MKYIKSLNEKFIVDEKSNDVLFDSEKLYSISQFIRIAKKSVEGKDAYDRDSNFGKGIKMAEHLKKHLSQHKFTCRVYRTEWNYGGNLVVTIELKGKSFREEVFSYNSANSTRQPNYSFAKMFNGTIKPSAPGKVINDWGMGTIHGSYQSISNYDKFMTDVVGIFNDYERVNGEAFDMKIAMAKFKTAAKIKGDWDKLFPRIEKEYSTAKQLGRKVNRYIEMRMPRLDANAKAVYFKHSEPRELRHPEEYGEVPELETKEYAKYEKHISKMTELIETFTKKYGFDFVWAASW